MTTSTDIQHKTKKRREEILATRAEPPKRIIITTPEICWDAVQKAYKKDRLHPYTYSSPAIHESFLGLAGKTIKKTMIRNLGIALHADSIETVEIVLPGKGLAFTPGRDVYKDLEDLKKLIAGFVIDKDIEVIGRIDEVEIDYSSFGVILRQCVDFRFAWFNISRLLEKNEMPFVLGSPGNIGIFAGRFNKTIENYATLQLIEACKETGAKTCIVINHGNGCGGYIHNRLDSADGILDIAT
ncbi:MAG: hypothetical protein UT66_C0008G0019, partial [candidate division CPR2 bacterium GW2011_GWC1_39_9]